MWLRPESRLRTYREFCKLLQDQESRVWMDRLLRFYVETGQGQKGERALNAAFAMGNSLPSSTNALARARRSRVGGRPKAYHLRPDKTMRTAMLTATT
jgi:hypothetical protein